MLGSWLLLLPVLFLVLSSSKSSMSPEFDAQITKKGLYTDSMFDCVAAG